MPDINRTETPAFPAQPENPAALAPLPCFVAPASLPLPQVCRIVRHLVAELVMMTADRASFRRDRRRMLCHVRQIAMYVCHVSLSIPQGDIGDAFGRDRSTVGHACSVVEDRRDDAAFDDLVSTVERMVATVFGCREVPRYE
ncbi:helix-turn-helix domain-containing protein [Rhizobium sp. CSW-27]|uniref:helix-turn-helix domain-containing protein n=1 Tax=Rhizobium sp. CSW-27 TaxID=2839985 RepID=UPI002078FA2A|nr:helix-turn-helix domain-containing protein [Rhizobium sp. CSW-27]